MAFVVTHGVPLGEGAGRAGVGELPVAQQPASTSVIKTMAMAFMVNVPFSAGRALIARPAD